MAERGLFSALQDDSNFIRNKGNTCSFCELLLILDKEEAKLLNERLSNRSITGASISKVLRDNGYKITEGVVQRHRRGGCKSGS